MCFLALHDFVSVLKRWDTRRKTSSIWYNNLTNRQMLPSKSLEMFLECYSVEGINLIKHEISKPQLAMDIGLLWQILTSNSLEMFLECYSVESIKLIKHEMSKPYPGLLIFRGKKSKIARDFQGQIRGKIGRFRGIFAGKMSKFVEKLADFARFSREKSQNSQKNRPISRDFSGKKSNFEGFSGANS